MYVKGHKTKVHVMRTIHQKPHYISQKHSPPITSLALPLSTWLLFHNQNYSPFLLRVTKGSLRNSHLIIMSRARSIITLIISTIKRHLKMIRWGRKSKTTKMGLSPSNTTNPGVHLTHLIRNMVKKTTKISTHELELIHDGSKRCLYSRRRRWSRQGRGSRGIGSILSSSNVSLFLLGRGRVLMRPLGLSSQLCITPPYESLTNSTHYRGKRGRRNRDVHVCKDTCDNWRKN